MERIKLTWFWPSIWLLASAAVEAGFQKWIAVKVLLIAATGFALLGLLLGLLRRKDRQKEQYQVPEWLEWLWNGEWIRTKEAKKKRKLLYLSRLTLVIAFFAIALWRLTSDGVLDNLESVLLILVWVLVGFAALASELRDDLPTRTELASASPEEAALDMRLRQLEGWLADGLIGREEYETLKEQALKGEKP